MIMPEAFPRRAPSQSNKSKLFAEKIKKCSYPIYASAELLY